MKTLKTNFWFKYREPIFFIGLAILFSVIFLGSLLWFIDYLTSLKF
jgi:hypothetical protein